VTGQPQIGDRFNPWQRWKDKLMSYPPETVWRQPGLDPGPKAVYHRLFYYAGKTGFCWPEIETLRQDLGAGRQTIYRWLADLEGYRLICHEKRAGRRSNTYYFLWHRIFEGTTVARQTEGFEVPTVVRQRKRDGTSRGTTDGSLKYHFAPFEVPTVVQESINPGIQEGNLIESPSSSSSCSSSIGGSGGNATETTTTCPPSSENQNTETERLRGILNKYRNDWWKKTLRAPLTQERLLSFQKLGRTPDEIGMALETKANTLMDKPVETWHYVQKVVKTYFETECPEAAAQRQQTAAESATRTLGGRAQGPQPQILEAEVLSSEPLSPDPDCLVDVVQYVARNGGYRGEAMAGWIAAYAGPEVKRSELQNWRERAHAALRHCPKCEDRGCTSSGNPFNPTPCICGWAIGLGYRKPSAEELAEVESEVWV